MFPEVKQDEREKNRLGRQNREGAEGEGKKKKGGVKEIHGVKITSGTMYYRDRTETILGGEKENRQKKVDHGESNEGNITDAKLKNRNGFNSRGGGGQ